MNINHICFPNLKIGGPAVASIASGYREEWVDGLFNVLGDVKPDFFSWHIYTNVIEEEQKLIRDVRALMDRYGLSECESILNEWNYVKGWGGDEWVYTLKMEKSLKGASFIAATMLMSQNEPLDMLMYYDARPCGMNGMFNTDMVNEVLKGYYPFYMFNKLYKAGTAVKVAREEGSPLWLAAAKGEEQNTMVAYYDDDDSAPARDVKVTFQNVENKNGVKLEYYLLDEEHDCVLVREEIFTATEFSTYVKMTNFSTYLFKIVAL